MDALNNQKVIFKVEITCYEDGQMSVTGPIEQPVIFFDIMNQAERIILNRVAETMKRQHESRIIKPEMKVAGCTKN